jgi:hypothetical protein
LSISYMDGIHGNHRCFRIPGWIAEYDTDSQLVYKSDDCRNP